MQPMEDTKSEPKKYYVVARDEELDFDCRNGTAVGYGTKLYVSDDLLDVVVHSVWRSYPCFTYEEIGSTGRYYFEELYKGAFDDLPYYRLFQTKGKSVDDHIKPEAGTDWFHVVSGERLWDVDPHSRERPNLLNEVTKECEKRGVIMVYFDEHVAFRHYHGI